jgi:cellulose synthase/poly-beta-1,6-N-acetylglucosamine synthase-like glycosyltransferase
MILSTIILALAFVTLAATLFNVMRWPRVQASLQSEAGTVSVLIPARNEESNLPECLESVLLQGAAIQEILIYDDHSTDATAKIVRQYAQGGSGVRLLSPIPLEAGWCGKNFACFQLADVATSDWLLFLDADARLAPGAVNGMLAEMKSRKLTLLSCWPALITASFWEAVVMPMLNFVVFSIYPAPLSLRYNYPSLALAHGACMMFERGTYFEIGGHSAVREQIFEDTELARLWRTKGERSLCLDGQAIVRVRMYSSLPEIWRGFQKNFFPAFRHEASFWIFLSYHFCVFLAPFLVFAYDFSILAGIAAICVLLARWVLSFSFGQPMIAVLAHPIAETILLGIGLSSWMRCKSGKGVVWKGREYLSSD